MKKGWLIKSKCGRWMRNILKGATLTSVLFIVQACYGTKTPLNPDDKIMVQGKVVSSTTGEPIKGIKVSFEDYSESVYTNENGIFVLYSWKKDRAELKFQDVDGAENGSFMSTKKSIKLLSDQYIDIRLQEN